MDVSIIRGGGMAGIANRTQLTSDALPREAAPVSREVTSPGMSTSTQCQKPEGVGASGSKQVTT